MYLLPLGLTVTLPLAWCLLRFATRRPDAERPAGRFASWQQGVGWAFLWALPALLVQDAWIATGQSSTSFGADDYLMALAFQPWVLAGGGSVQALFEATAKAISGHRQATMLDNWPLYAATTYAKLAALGAVAAWRLGRLRTREAAWSEPLLLLLGAAALADALAGVPWPWWGS